jgi:hypothetical protein
LGLFRQTNTALQAHPCTERIGALGWGYPLSLSQCCERCGGHHKYSQPLFDIHHDTTPIVRSNYHFHTAKLNFFLHFGESKS